jgi:hypothetical protein
MRDVARVLLMIVCEAWYRSRKAVIPCFVRKMGENCVAIRRSVYATKNFMRRHFPRTMAFARKLYYVRESRRLRQQSIETVFSNIHLENTWGSQESVSGEGSTFVQTDVIRSRLPALIQQWGIRTMLDLPCGDFHWMKEISLDLDHYIGSDIVSALIERNRQRYGRGAPNLREFVRLDVTSDDLPCVDLVFCRDCLVHLTNADVIKALKQVKASGTTYLLTTTYPERKWNENIPTGLWRPLNLERPPFNLPRPLDVVIEGSTEGKGGFSDKCLGLWRVADLPSVCSEVSRAA